MSTSITPVQRAKVLRMKEIWERLGISRSKGYELLRDDPDFPMRVRLGPRAMGVVETHLDVYIAGLISTR